MRLYVVNNPSMPSDCQPDSFQSQFSAAESILQLDAKLPEQVMTTLCDPKHRNILQQLDLRNGEMAVNVNGRHVALSARKPFSEIDFQTLIKYERCHSIEFIASNIAVNPDASFPDTCLLITQFMSLRRFRVEIRKDTEIRQPIGILDQFRDSEIAISSGNREKDPVYLVAVANPITPDGQKLISVINALSNVSGVCFDIFLVGQQLPDTEKRPLDRFYQLIFPLIPTFNSMGEIGVDAISFNGLPSGPTLTLGVDVPESWLASPKSSVSDLDNIKMSRGDAIYAKFVLSSILVQGHATEGETGDPPRGLQFVLGTWNDTEREDTITMANLGYFQLKAQAGIWDLKIRAGRSDLIYNLTDLGQPNQSSEDLIINSGQIAVASFGGLVIHPTVSRKAGMEKEDVLGPAKKSVIQWIQNR